MICAQTTGKCLKLISNMTGHGHLSKKLLYINEHIKGK